MSLQLTPVSVAAPGFKGLNKSSSAVDLEPAWALDATNCILDRTGRIASRKGWTAVTTSPIGGTPNIESLGEYLTITGTTQFISAANNIIYSGSATLTNIYSTAITANRWQMVNFNNFLWLFQRGHAPLRWNGAAMVTILSIPAVGTPPQGNCVCAAYGRLWVGDTSTDKTILYFSDTLLGQNWSAGAAGTLDLKSVWKEADSIVAISAFNGFLVIFGTKSILVYQSPSNPASMTLVEHIKGIGCIARDSVQDIGTDLLFLSDTGVRSLARTIQEKSMPLKDLTKNVRDDIVSTIKQQATSTLEDVRSVYHEPDGFYLVSFPLQNVVFCLDIRRVLEDQSAPITLWNNINPRALLSSRDRDLYIGKAGVIGKHTGYSDNGSSYDMNYVTAWMSFGSPFILKILKKIIFTVVGSNNTVFSIKWAFDYTSNYFYEQKQIMGGESYEYNIAEYNIAEYSTGLSIDEISAPGRSSGKMVQIGMLLSVNGSQIALQKFDVYAKSGRMI